MYGGQGSNWETEETFPQSVSVKEKASLSNKQKKNKKNTLKLLSVAASILTGFFDATTTLIAFRELEMSDA